MILLRQPLRMLDDAFADDLGTERVTSIVAESKMLEYEVDDMTGAFSNVLR